MEFRVLDGLEMRPGSRPEFWAVWLLGVGLMVGLHAPFG